MLIALRKICDMHALVDAYALALATKLKLQVDDCNVKSHRKIGRACKGLHMRWKGYYLREVDRSSIHEAVNVQPSSSRMRAALWALLAVSAAQAGRKSFFVDSHSSPCVFSLRGGDTNTPREGQEDRNIKAAQPGSSSERRHRTAAAWSVPWLARRRRRSRGKGVDGTRGREAVPSADPAGKITPEAAFSSALASFVGAMIVSGGTLGMWPQSVGASPFDPRPPPKSVRQPFFEGWFIRWDFDMFTKAHPGHCCSYCYPAARFIAEMYSDDFKPGCF